MVKSDRHSSAAMVKCEIAESAFQRVETERREEG